MSADSERAAAELAQTLQAAERALKSGDAATAFSLAEQVVASAANNLAGWVIRTNAATARSDWPEVIVGLLRLLQMQPAQPQFTRMLAAAHNNQGVAEHRRGRLAEAISGFGRATEVDPQHPQAWFNLADTLLERGDLVGAANAIEQHRQRVPNDRRAIALFVLLSANPEHIAALCAWPESELREVGLAWLAQTAIRTGRSDLATDWLCRWDTSDDPSATLHCLADLKSRADQPATLRAASHIAMLARNRGQSLLQAELIAALSLPAVYESEAHVLESRAGFESGLTRLEQAWQDGLPSTCQPVLPSLAQSNFLLAYQGLDDRELQRRYARLIEQACQSWRPELCEFPHTRKGRRVGLLSSFWRQCTVGVYFSGWIRWLREAGFEVFLYQLGPRRDATTDALAAAASHFRFLEGSIESCAHAVRGDALDLLIYPELGMDARVVPLAALRLARHQAVAWGHPVTSGFSTLSSYLSCAEMEPPQAQLHYCESLHLLPGLGVDYARSSLPPPRTAAQLGLSTDRPKVLVPQSVFKLHPAGDAVMAAIAAAQPNVQFVLFAAEYPEWMQRYQQRLGRVFAEHGLDHRRHLTVLPLCERERYLQVNTACDLMLDSLHWSGGNTALDALSCGLPVVACPGQFMRGRQSAAMLNRLGVGSRLVAASPDEQARIALGVLRDPAGRHELGQQIRTGLDDLFDSAAARSCFLGWVEQVLE